MNVKAGRALDLPEQVGTGAGSVRDSVTLLLVSVDMLLVEVGDSSEFL